MNKKICFIGAGNMGGALIRAVCKNIGGDSVAIYDISTAATDLLRLETGCTVCNSAAEAVESAEFVVYCVKPQTLESALTDTAGALRKGGKAVVSIAAAVDIATITAALSANNLSLPVIRIMPNLAASVGMGTLLVTADGNVHSTVLDELCGILKLCGDIITVDEHTLDLGMSISGCAPAFTAVFIEALADGGVEIGLPRPLAMRLAIQTVAGTATLLRETGMHPGAFKDAVCSPGGTTIAGIAALEVGAFRADTASAVRAANRRNGELK